jgi:hypothetical protein
MVWNCPHCKAPLFASDALLGTSTILTQCPECDRAALVRRAGNQCIKVDKIPQGERVLIAQSLTSASPQISSQADRVVQKTPWPQLQKPVIRPAVRRASIPKRPEIFGVQQRPGETNTAIEVAVSPTPSVVAAVVETTPQRTFEIPYNPRVMAVGHSVRQSRSFRSQGIPLVSALTFLLVVGIFGWNAIHYAPNQLGNRRSEIIDRVNQRAMAPNRRLNSSDDPTAIRPKNTGVPIYTGPGQEFQIVETSPSVVSILYLNAKGAGLSLRSIRCMWRG